MEARLGMHGQDVHVTGGTDVIRHTFGAALVDELTIMVAPVVRAAAGVRFIDNLFVAQSH
jgi:dihydrofolate reductase